MKVADDQLLDYANEIVPGDQSVGIGALDEAPALALEPFGGDPVVTPALAVDGFLDLGERDADEQARPEQDPLHAGGRIAEDLSLIHI